MREKNDIGDRQGRSKAFKLRGLIESRIYRIDIGHRDKSLSFEYDEWIPETLIGNEKDLGELLTLLTSYAWERLERGKLEVAAQGFDETDDRVKVQISFCESGLENRVKDSTFRQRLFVNAEDDGADGRAMSHICARLSTELIVLKGPQGERFTAFTVALEKDRRTALSRSEACSSLCLKGKRLLLVEDNDIYREALKGHFTKWGIEVAEARDGERAVELIDTTSPFDFGVFDNSLPGMTGSDLARYCRKRIHRNNMRIISLSGPGKTEAGNLFDECLVKPALPIALKNTLFRFSDGCC